MNDDMRQKAGEFVKGAIHDHAGEMFIGHKEQQKIRGYLLALLKPEDETQCPCVNWKAGQYATRCSLLNGHEGAHDFKPYRGDSVQPEDVEPVFCRSCMTRHPPPTCPEWGAELREIDQREDVEPEAECERCTSLHDHFELAEEPSQVAHPHMGDYPGGFCLVCGNLGAHPWHEDAPSLSALQEIGKYLATMGFRMVREYTNADTSPQQKPVAWMNKWDDYTELWTLRGRADLQIQSWHDTAIGDEDGSISQTPLYTPPNPIADPVAMSLYTKRCGWCGANEGTVDPTEPCATEPSTGEYIGPHQFEILEEFTGTLYASPPRVDEALSDGCLDMIRETLEAMGTDMSKTPPYMYPEAIRATVTRLVAEVEREPIGHLFFPPDGGGPRYYHGRCCPESQPRWTVKPVGIVPWPESDGEDEAVKSILAEEGGGDE